MKKPIYFLTVSTVYKNKKIEKKLEDIIPSDFHLSQNYPNPFKGKTIIKYCVPDRTKIKLEVFNSAGKSITILVNEIKQPGTYQVEFSAKGIPIGDYFYTFKSGKFVETKKMVLLR